MAYTNYPNYDEKVYEKTTGRAKGFFKDFKEHLKTCQRSSRGLPIITGCRLENALHHNNHLERVLINIKDSKNPSKAYSKKEGSHFLRTMDKVEIEENLVWSGDGTVSGDILFTLVDGNSHSNILAKIKKNKNDEISIIIRKKQIILYGPPGTGKTFNTKYLAVTLCEEDLNDR